MSNDDKSNDIDLDLLDFEDEPAGPGLGAVKKQEPRDSGPKLFDAGQAGLGEIGAPKARPKKTALDDLDENAAPAVISVEDAQKADVGALTKDEMKGVILPDDLKRQKTTEGRHLDDLKGTGSHVTVEEEDNSKTWMLIVAGVVLGFAFMIFLLTKLMAAQSAG